MEKSNHPQHCVCNEGISCSVCNCEYHDGQSKCTAEKISIGPEMANCCSDTRCATFRAKSSR